MEVDEMHIAANLIAESLLKSRGGTNLSIYNTFDTFLSVCEAALLGVGGQEWKRLTTGIEGALPQFQFAFVELIYQAGRSYCDLLGPCYMMLGHQEARLGQFFTPWPAAHFIAEILIGNLQEISQSEPLCVLDSACGSGVMLLAIAEVLSNSVLKHRRVIFAGLDIDPLCVKMTRLNLLLHGLMDCTLLIKRPNDITEEEHEILSNALHVR